MEKQGLFEIEMYRKLSHGIDLVAISSLITSQREGVSS